MTLLSWLAQTPPQEMAPAPVKTWGEPKVLKFYRPLEVLPGGRVMRMDRSMWLRSRLLLEPVKHLPVPDGCPYLPNATYLRANDDGKSWLIASSSPFVPA